MNNIDANARSVALVNRPRPRSALNWSNLIHPFLSSMSRYVVNANRDPIKIASVSFETYSENIINCGRKQARAKL